jgi:3-oxoacyl-[acyl-carrier protein] reductase
LRNVIVTGASRGLGLEIAATLAASGYRVIAIARSQSEPLRALIESTRAAGHGAVQFQAFDLLETARLAQLVSGVRKEVGPLYGLINNAGLGTSGVLAMMREEQIETLVRLNTLSPIILTKHVVRSMMSERAGRIINISSVVASTGYQGRPGRLHPLAGARGRAARHHGERNCPRIRRHRDDERTYRQAARSAHAPQRPASSARRG